MRLLEHCLQALPTLQGTTSYLPTAKKAVPQPRGVVSRDPPENDGPPSPRGRDCFVHLHSVVHVDKVRMHDPKSCQIFCCREHEPQPTPSLLQQNLFQDRHCISGVLTTGGALFLYHYVHLLPSY